MMGIGLFLNMNLIMATILHYPVNIASNVKILKYRLKNHPR